MEATNHFLIQSEGNLVKKSHGSGWVIKALGVMGGGESGTVVLLDGRVFKLPPKLIYSYPLISANYAYPH